MASIKFQIHLKVQYGQAVYLANSQLNWQINDSTRMNCIRPSLWELQFDVQETIFQYKYAISDYNLCGNNEILWEKDPNRVLTVNQATSYKKDDKWERRKITLIIPQLYENSIVVLLGDQNPLRIPRLMKLGQHNGKKYFYKKLWIDSHDFGKNISYSQYLLIFGEDPQEYVSKQKSMTISEENNVLSEKIKFFRLAN